MVFVTTGLLSLAKKTIQNAFLHAATARSGAGLGARRRPGVSPGSGLTETATGPGSTGTLTARGDR